MQGKYNLKVRNHAKEQGVFLYEVAKRLNVSDPTLTRRLRYELDETEQQKYIHAIDEIAASRATV